VAFFAIAIANALWGNANPIKFLGPDHDPIRWLPWLLACAGAVVRIWGAGNLRKNKEVTQGGIYRMVKHPLYLGNCLIFLAFFLALGSPLLNLAMFSILLLPHYCCMVLEEQRLEREYPQAFEAWRCTPRLVPNVRSFREALATDCFTLQRAYRNRSLRSLWAPILLPVVAEAVAVLRLMV